ncbi:MAG: 50S ribosomal protein L32, partial [Eubacteriales bacterium]
QSQWENWRRYSGSPPGSVHPDCNEMVKPHCVCKKCGFYGGKKVLSVKEDS